jgi:hypothetical protein
VVIQQYLTTTPCYAVVVRSQGQCMEYGSVFEGCQFRIDCTLRDKRSRKRIYLTPLRWYIDHVEQLFIRPW